MSHGFSNKRVFFGIACIVLAAGSAAADDVKVQPAAGGGFVVTDQTGATERLRVDEAGGVSVPGLAASASPNNGVCRDATTGQLGTCPVNSNQIAVDVLGAFVKVVSVTKYFSCDLPSICPIAEGEVYVTATCGEADADLPAVTGHPATSPFAGDRWWAIATTCSVPVSLNLHFKLADTYPTYKVIRDSSGNAIPTTSGSEKLEVSGVADRSQFSTCLYSGFLGAFSIETLTNKTVCIRAGN